MTHRKAAAVFALQQIVMIAALCQQTAPPTVLSAFVPPYAIHTKTKMLALGKRSRQSDCIALQPLQLLHSPVMHQRLASRRQKTTTVAVSRASEMEDAPRPRKRDMMKQVVRQLLAGRPGDALETLQQHRRIRLFPDSAAAQASESAQAGVDEQVVGSDGTSTSEPVTPAFDERLQDQSTQYHGEALVRTRVVSAPLEACFAAASDFDSYKEVTTLYICFVCTTCFMVVYIYIYICMYVYE